MKLKNSNCDKPRKKTIMTQIFKKLKTQIVMNSNFDEKKNFNKTQKLKL